MTKIYETKINKFYGGIEDDPRSESAIGFQVTKHFDIYTYPKKLVPMRTMVADEHDGSSSTGMKSRSCKDFAYQPQNSNRVFALGTGSGGTGTEAFYKAAITGASWTSIDTDALTRFPGCFTADGSGLVYFFDTTNKILAVDNINAIIVGTGTLTNTTTSVAQGVTAKNATTYIGQNRRVVVADINAVTEAYVGPTGSRVNSMCNYGNYLALGFYSTYTGRSFVHIWDLVAANPTEVIDWGEGELKVLENLDGTLVGISDEYMSQTIGNDKGKMVIREWGGGEPQITKEIEALYTGGYIRQYKSVKGGRIRFAAAVPQSASEKYEGIWSYGKKSAIYPKALTIEVVDSDIDADGIDGFAQVGNFDIIAHSADGSINRTQDTDIFTETSIYESQILNEGDSSVEKQLMSVTVEFDPLPTAGQVVLKYKMDAETSYTTIFTDTTDSNISHRATNIESTGVSLPIFKEITFRTESTGGARITGLSFEHIKLNPKTP